MPANREFLHPEFVRKPLDAVAAGLDYPSTEVGTAGKISVYYATSLGTAGKTLASEILGRVVGTYGEMEAFFGIQGGSVSVIVAPLSGKNDGSGGAYHYGCDFTSGGTIYVDATFALPNAADVEMALYVAELSECFMGAQGRGGGAATAMARACPASAPRCLLPTDRSHRGVSPDRAGCRPGIRTG